MKKLSLIFVFLLSMGVILTSCKKDDDDDKENVSTEESAEVLSNALSSSSAGVYSQVGLFNAAIAGAPAVTEKSLQSEICDFSDNQTHKLEFNGPQRQFSYSFSYEYGFQCTGGVIPTSFYYNYSGTGNYNGPYLKTNDQRSGDWVVTALLPTDAYYIVNGTSLNVGNIEFISADENTDSKTINSTTNFVFTDLNVDKTTGEVVSGTGEFTISGTVPQGVPFNHSGNLAFSGDKQVSATINSDTYNINLQSGEVTKQ